MKNLLGLLFVITLFVACQNGEKKATDNNDEANTEVSMETPKVDLKEFYSIAADNVDKEVITQGIVDHVCRHGGKKLFLVADDADLHIDGEERFDENLTGSEIVVKGIVREFRVDEAYCLQMEEDAIQSHSKGESTDEILENKKADIAYYRDSMAVAGVDHLSYYSLEYISHEEIK